MRFFPLDHEKGAKCAFDNFRKEWDRERESEKDRANSAFSRATVCNKDNNKNINCPSVCLPVCPLLCPSVCVFGSVNSRGTLHLTWPATR